LGARQTTQQLGKLVEANVRYHSATSWAGSIKEKLQGSSDHGPLADYGSHMIKRLLATGMDIKEIVWSQIVPTAGAMVANQAQVITQVRHPPISNSTSPSAR